MSWIIISPLVVEILIFLFTSGAGKIPGNLSGIDIDVGVVDEALGDESEGAEAVEQPAPRNTSKARELAKDKWRMIIAKREYHFYSSHGNATVLSKPRR